MSVAIDILKLRQPAIEYTAPAVCEITLSGSGFPNIDLTPFGELNPPGPLLPPDFPNVGFIWPDIPGVLCWNIYQYNEETEQYTLVSGCDPGTSCTGAPGTKCWVPPGPGCYAVSGITLEGETPLSPVVCWLGPLVTTGGADPECV